MEPSPQLESASQHIVELYCIPGKWVELKLWPYFAIKMPEEALELPVLTKVTQLGSDGART